jgi:hypothetical protein
MVIAIFVTSCFMTGCQKEESDFISETPLYKTYLSITDFSSKTTFSETGVNLIVLMDVAYETPRLLRITEDGEQEIKTYQEFNSADFLLIRKKKSNEKWTFWREK